MLEFIIEIKNYLMSFFYDTYTNTNINENKYSYLNSLTIEEWNQSIKDYNTILTKQEIEEIYKTVNLGTNNSLKLDFDIYQTKTVNEIWLKLDQLGIDIKRQELWQIVKYYRANFIKK